MRDIFVKVLTFLLLITCDSSAIKSKKVMKTSNSVNRRQGFTLVELLVVIAIIAVLVGVGATAIVKFRSSGDKAVAISNMRQIQTANVSYANDHSSRYVSPTDVVDSVVVSWWQNPEYVSQLKTAESTYVSGAAAPDVTLPISLMDPAISKRQAPGFDQLAGSYAYNTEGMPLTGGALQGFKMAAVEDPGRSAAFFTADFAAGGEVDHARSGNIAYRHDNKAIVVYYDGHASTISSNDVTSARGGATGTFWSANQ